MLKIYDLQYITNVKLRSDFVFMIFKLELSEKVLKRLITDLVNFFKYFHFKHNRDSTILDGIIVSVNNFMEDLHLNITMMSINSML